MMSDEKDISFLYVKKAEKHAVIDKEDKIKCLAFRWRLKKSAHTSYICASKRENGKIKTIRLQRFIMNAPENMEVHHKNEDIYDNRKENLQLLTGDEHRKLHANG